MLTDANGEPRQHIGIHYRCLFHWLNANLCMEVANGDDGRMDDELFTTIGIIVRDLMLAGF